MDYKFIAIMTCERQEDKYVVVTFQGSMLDMLPNGQSFSAASFLRGLELIETEDIVCKGQFFDDLPDEVNVGTSNSFKCFASWREA
jgi:hypothetical protein